MAKKGAKDSNGRDEQPELLRGIWNEMKGLRSEFRSELSSLRTELGERIDAVRIELKSEIFDLRGATGDLCRAMTEADVKLATSVTELAGDGRELNHLVRDWHDEHRKDRDDFRDRIVRIEKHVGLAS